ncbi:MAG TPA: Uma2 family endonuclease [Gemmataceae bacterium]|nr:Uma2 family endonuclease [Gemmataceae bacterium]
MTPTTAPTLDTLADLLHHLGDIPLERIRLRPAPGTATEQDVIAALDGPDKRLYELIDGVLVEKVMSTREALLAGVLVHYLWDFVEEDDLGLVLPADGALRLQLGLVRIPDACFISWDRLPEGQLPDEAIAGVVPDLAVEVLSEGNTKAEMDRKLRDYFETGVRLVWFIQPKTQTATAYTSPTKSRRVGKEQALDGGDVLPGFRLYLKELFARAKRRQRKGR